MEFPAVSVDRTRILSDRRVRAIRTPRQVNFCARKISKTRPATCLLGFYSDPQSNQ